MIHKFTVILLFVCICTTPIISVAENDLAMQDLKLKYGKAKAIIGLNYEKNITQVNEQYEKLLNKLETTLKKEGDLDGIIALRREQRLFKEDKTVEKESIYLPPSLKMLKANYHNIVTRKQKDRNKRITTLQNQYIIRLKALQADLVQKDQIDAALRVKTEIGRISFELADLASKMPREKRIEKAKQSKPETTARPIVEKAILYITCDNHYVVWLNGEEIGRGWTWSRLDKYSVVITEGDILAIEATDLGEGNGSAGLYCCIVLESNNKSYGIEEDWRCSIKKQPLDWASSNLIKCKDSLSVKTVPFAHRGQVKIFRKDNPHLQGEFVWSKKPSTTIYIHKTISFNNFSEVKR